MMKVYAMVASVILLGWGIGLAIGAATGPKPAAKPAPASLDAVGAVSPSSYTVCSAGSMVLIWGAAVEVTVDADGTPRLGQGTYLPGDVLPEGSFMLAVDSGVGDAMDDADPIVMRAGEMVVVTGPVAGPVADSGSVTCRAGYYACCYMQKGPGGGKRARCRADSEDDSDCEAGGKGSSECSYDSSRLQEAPEH